MSKPMASKKQSFEGQYLKQSIHKGISVFDGWMGKKTPLDKGVSEQALKPGDLGFGQLNDLLLSRYQPVFLQEAEAHYPDPADNQLLLRYPRLRRDNAAFRDFDVDTFFCEVQQKINLHLDIPALDYAEEAFLQCLHQNLVMVVFSVERWSQQVLGNEPGKAAKEIIFIAANLSLHDYLQQCLGNYNTLQNFALSSVTGVDTVAYPRWEKGEFRIDKYVGYSSRYQQFDRMEGEQKQRFPSEMDLSAFPQLIKKGELVGYIYNEKLLTLNESVRLFGLEGKQSLGLCRDTLLLFRYATSLFTRFHRDPLFNDSKFIHVLRQFTVALEKCPATILFEDVAVDSPHWIAVRGFINHYLTRKSLDKQEALLFVKQILLDEGMDRQRVYHCIHKWFALEQPVREGDFPVGGKSLLISPLKTLLAVCRELVSGADLGVARLRYTLNLVALKYPDIYEQLNPRVSAKWLSCKAHAINTAGYRMVPSGANSVAYLGPDIIFGSARNIPNYFIHMINRLNVMPLEDRHRFWALLNLSGNHLLEHLREYSQRANTAEAIEAELLARPFLAEYVDLFEGFARLGRTHDATINKFIRKLDKNMSCEDKNKLVSGPQAGTTFMLPNGQGVATHLPELPSLELFAKSRSAHLLSTWVKPLASLRREKRLPACVVDGVDMDGLDDLMFPPGLKKTRFRHQQQIQG